MPDIAKAVWIFISYNFCNTVCFTAYNLAYSALSARMTRNIVKRAELASYRLGMAPMGRLFATTFTLPFVKLLGDTQQSWMIVIAIWSALALIPAYLCFRNCKEFAGEEVDAIAAQQPPVKIGPALKHTLTNPYWWMVSALWGLASAHYGLIGSVVPYYCKYLLGNDTLYSVVNAVEICFLIISAFLSGQLSKKFAKSHISFIGCLIGVASQAVFMLNPFDFSWMLITVAVRTMGIGISIPCVFSMIGDAAEYQQYKNHVREEGIVFSASGIGNKMGTGLCSAICGFLLTAAGYVSSTAGETVVQSESALQAIQDVYNGGFYIIWGAQAIIFLIWFRLDKKLPAIMAELKERAARNEF